MQVPWHAVMGNHGEQYHEVVHNCAAVPCRSTSQPMSRCPAQLLAALRASFQCEQQWWPTHPAPAPPPLCRLWRRQRRLQHARLHHQPRLAGACAGGGGGLSIGGVRASSSNPASKFPRVEMTSGARQLSLRMPGPWMHRKAGFFCPFYFCRWVRPCKAATPAGTATATAP